MPAKGAKEAVVEQEMVGLVERLGSAATALEAAAAWFEERQSAMALEADAGVGRIVATVASAREEELERKLAESEAKLAELQATGTGGRKTAGVGRMLAKESGETISTAKLDAALGSLSVEQRIAVKAELMRAGLV